MFHRFSIAIRVAFLSILLGSLVVACGDRSRSRPALDAKAANKKQNAGGTQDPNTEGKNEKKDGDGSGATTPASTAKTTSEVMGDKNKKDKKDQKTSDTVNSGGIPLDLQARLSGIDLIFEKENQKGKQEIWKNKGKSITDKIFSLKLDTDSKAVIAITALVKINLDKNSLLDQITFKSNKALSVSDLATDLELTEITSETKISNEDIRKNLGKIVIRYLQDQKNFLVRIVSDDASEAAVVFNHDEETHVSKVIQVLGQESENEKVSKRLNQLTIVTTRVDSLTQKLKSANSTLKEVSEAMLVRPEIMKNLGDKYITMSQMASSLIADAEALKGQGLLSIRAQGLGDLANVQIANKKSIEIEDKLNTDIDALNKVIVEAAEVSRAEIDRSGGESTEKGRAVKSQILDKLLSVKIEKTVESEKKDADAKKQKDIMPAAKLPVQIQTIH